MARIYFRENGGIYQRYRAAAAAMGWELGGEGRLEDYEGLLLPGGGDLEPWRYGQQAQCVRNLDPARDDDEWRLLEAFVEAGKPVLGICRGMQVINAYFGGTLFQNLSGHSQLGGADRVHPVRNTDPVWKRELGESMVVNSAHHQAVDRLGRGLLATQLAEDGVIEGLRHEELPIWAVQWHPERWGTIGSSLLRACPLGRFN